MWDNMGDEWWVLPVMVFVLVVSFIGLAIVCDEHLVKSLETLCVRWNVREDVAGASFMAFGSSAPEIIINAVSTIESQMTTDQDTTELGLGAVIGSGLIAFLVIPALCALAAPGGSLELKRRPLVRDILFYLLSLFSVVMSFRDGVITPFEGLALVLIYVVYLLVVVFASQVRILYNERMNTQLLQKACFVLQHREATKWAENASSHESGGGDTVQEITRWFYVTRAVGIAWNILVWPLKILFTVTCPACGEGERFETWYFVTFCISFCWVAFFSFLISSIVEEFGNRTGIPLSFFGVVLVAMGAEVPDTIQSVTVSKRGYGSMAVSNCIGSQITNLCIGLGLPWLLSSLVVTQKSHNGANNNNGSSNGVVLPGYKAAITISYFQFAAVGLNAVLLVAWQLLTCDRKAYLTRSKGVVMLVAYFVILGLYSWREFVM
eukprot:c9996_g1_i1.p1 GENE.c9996_g1_i1~~c9996_g1_i1.p1  ORF type:complete len:454 (+),score=81.70 c9996_g1_i1:56-1363(+)